MEVKIAICICICIYIYILGSTRGYILGELTHTTAWINNAKEFMAMLNIIDQCLEMLKNTLKLLKSKKGLFVSSSGS